MRKKEELEKAAELSYISSLLSSVPNAANIHYHCKIIREKSILRSLINSATSIVSRGYEDTKNVDGSWTMRRRWCSRSPRRR